MVFPARLSGQLKKDLNPTVGRLNEQREMLSSRRPRKTIKMVPESR
jgi:hypothetical protein